MKPILDIQHLGKSYGKAEILKDISISMEKGEFLVLIGPSGSGKSTLLSCIAGLTETTLGAVSINGKDMTHAKPAHRDIAMVFQSYALFPTMSIEKNISFGMKIRGVEKGERDKRVERVAEMLKITPLLDRKPAQLSGGQRQRVAMARALVRNPSIYLFDEPLSNLDAKLRVTMRTEIKRLHKATNGSMVYVTHDQVEAMTLATRIVLLNYGVLQQIGTPQELYNGPCNTFVAKFMGSPAMNILPALVTKQGDGVEVILNPKSEAPIRIFHDSPPESLRQAQGREVLFGIRPEAITDASDSNEASFTHLVDLLEPAGADTYALLSFGEFDVTARLHPGTCAESGEPHDFYVDMAHAIYFDKESTERIGE